jgi:hypothetical protein
VVFLRLGVYFVNIILIGVILLGLQGCSNDEKELDKLVCQIAAENVLTGAKVGYAGEKSIQYLRYEQLSNKASNELGSPIMGHYDNHPQITLT